MQERCRGCPHFEWDEGGHGYPETALCTAGEHGARITWCFPCPLEMAERIAAAALIDPESGCRECWHFGRVDMGWSHSDVTDYCWLTRTREPERGIKGCIFRPSGR